MLALTDITAERIETLYKKHGVMPTRFMWFRRDWECSGPAHCCINGVLGVECNGGVDAFQKKREESGNGSWGPIVDGTGLSEDWLAAMQTVWDSPDILYIELARRAAEADLGVALSEIAAASKKLCG